MASYSDQTTSPPEVLDFSLPSHAFLAPYLPPSASNSSPLPFTTLTYATSLDGAISLGAGLRTPLSGAASKAMTHFLRSRHDAILVGVGTALADDPGLNCRLRGVGGGYGGEGLEGQPVPVVLDPRGRWKFTREAKTMRLAREKKGRAPIVITAIALERDQAEILGEIGGRHVELSVGEGGKFEWMDVLLELRRLGLKSVMVEGGRVVINDLLSASFSEGTPLVNSLIMTFAPVFLGEGAVTVSPPQNFHDRDAPSKKEAARQLTDITWGVLGPDAVLCGHLLPGRSVEG